MYKSPARRSNYLQDRLPAAAGPDAFCPVAGDGILSGSASGHPLRLLSWGQGKPETQVVVTVVRFVPVAIRRARIGGIVVPTAAAIDAVGTGRRPLRTKSQNGI
jgi:hypothetical protein